MTNLDEFWERANKKEVRGVSLNGWQETEFDFSKHIEMLTSVIDQLELWPARVEIYHGVKFKMKVCRWNNKAEAKLEQFNAIEAVSVISGLHPKLSRMDVALRSFHITRRQSWAFFDGSLDFMTLGLSAKILGILLKHITPTYGFSSRKEMGEAYWFHAGQPTGDLSEEQYARVDAHDQIKHVKEETGISLAHRLLDVFEMNILNPNHLQSKVGSVSLKQWISSGENGTLQQLKPNVYCWLVPDHIRPLVRDTLLKLGCLVVPV
jgi:hypothetical protein